MNTIVRKHKKSNAFNFYMKRENQSKISLKTNYGKAIIKRIIQDRGYAGDIEKLKTFSNLNMEGNPKPMRIKNHQNTYTDVMSYYYKDGGIELITTTNYLDCAREDEINKGFASELCIQIPKKQKENIQPGFIPEIGEIYVGSAYYSNDDVLVIITSKTSKQFRYKYVRHSYISTENEKLVGYTKTIDELIMNGYSVPDYFNDENILRLSKDGHWIKGNFSITSNRNYRQEGLYDRMSR